MEYIEEKRRKIAELLAEAYGNMSEIESILEHSRDAEWKAVHAMQLQYISDLKATYAELSALMRKEAHIIH